MRETISDISGFVVAISIFVFLLSIVWLIIRVIRKKSVKPGIIAVVTCIASIIIFTATGTVAWSGTEDYQIAMAEKEQEELERKAQEESQMRLEEQIKTEIETETESVNTKTEETNTEQTTEQPIDSEQEYKDKCVELYYDDVFFGDDDLEGKYVKLHLLLSEKYYFTADNIHTDTFKQYDDKYNLKRDFFKGCVLRKKENSYVGNSINVWFSDNYDVDVANYQTGDKIIVYAEVISWSNNTWDGFNSVTILPQYIEEE